MDRNWHNSWKLDCHVRRLWAATLHVLQHTVAVILGFVLIIAGLAMTFSIVFMVPGMFVPGIGVAIVVGGIWAHASGGP